MRPEQATADPHADHRSDLYAFGVIAYELLTGRTPFEGGSPQQVLAAHVTTPAMPVTEHRSSIPPRLAALVMQCLEKKPADRPQTGDEMIPVLEGVLTASGGITPGQTEARFRAAVLIASLGKRDEAVAMLREALNHGHRVGSDERLLHFWDRIRGYPPFEELVRLREQ